MLAPGEKSCDKPRQCIKKQGYHFADKGPYSQSFFQWSCRDVRIGHKEGWALKNWCFQTVVLEKTLEHLLDSKEIKPVNPQRNQPWIFIGKTDTKAEAPILWLPDVKSWLIGKDRDAGKDWRREKEVTEDERVEWHHWLNGHEFEKTSRDSEGQESLVCCSLWGRKESNPTEWLNNKNNSDISLDNSECMSWVSCVWLFVAPWTIACQAPLPMEFSRWAYWSWLPFPTPGDLPDPGIKPASFAYPALAARFLTTEPPGKPRKQQSLN